MAGKKKKKKKGVIHIGTEYEGDIIKIPHPKIYDKDGNEIIIHTPPPEMVTDPVW